MSTYDDFMRDAGQPVVPITASPPVSAYDQFMADAAKPVPPATPMQSPSLLSQVGRQVGLTGRAALVGATALPNMLWNGFGGAINWATGSHIPHVNASETADYVGLPKPQGAVENVAQDASGAMASVFPFAKAGQIIGDAASPVVAAIGKSLAAQPGMQTAISGGASGASGAAKGLGLNPWYQIGAGVLGTGVSAFGASGVTSSARATANALRNLTAPEITAAQAADRAASGVSDVFHDFGPQASQFYGPGQTNELTQSIIPMVRQNPSAKPSTLMRNQDFRSLGINPTTGQITRDPVQYAKELNMSGLTVGAPLAQQLNTQGNQLRKSLTGLVGTPQTPYTAGNIGQEALSGIDSGLQSGVSDAYAAAKASSGSALDVPLTGLSQDYATALKNFGDKVPSGVRNNFNQYGLLTGTQNKTFSVEDAENLLKVINSNQSNDPATNAALSYLRASVKNAVLSADDQGGVYAPARELASQRFALHDQIPALDAAASGSVAPDDFVRKFVVNGKTDDVQHMADLLRQQAPGAFGEMRSQLGGALHDAAFGIAPAGDSKFNPSSYARALRNIGPAKLGAFYSPDEINQFHTIGRVGSYMNSVPSGSPVNFSNTASALGQSLHDGMIKVPFIGGLLDNFQNRSFVGNALRGTLASPNRSPQSFNPEAMAAALMRVPVPLNSSR